MHGLNGMAQTPQKAYKFPAELSNLGAKAKKADLGITQVGKSAKKAPGKKKESMSTLETVTQWVQAQYGGSKRFWEE